MDAADMLKKFGGEPRNVLAKTELDRGKHCARDPQDHHKQSRGSRLGM